MTRCATGSGRLSAYRTARSPVLGLGAIASGFLFSLTAVAAQTIDYVVVADGQKMGHMIVKVDENQRTIDYSAKNNGRGPSLQLVYRLDAAGLPQGFQSAGDTGLGIPPDERLVLNDDGLSWHLAGKTGRAIHTARGFYYPQNASPEGIALLARAMLDASTTRMPLFPAGEARLEVASERTVSVAGQSKTVRLVLIEGLELGPQPIWLDAEGELFAQLSTARYSTIRAGWEPALPQLLAEQDALKQARYRAVASSLNQGAVGPVVLRHVNLFDSRAAVIRPDRRVTLRGNRIERVEMDDSRPLGKTEIDGRGRTLLPGLWDMHVHVESYLDGLMHVANGILSARDMGNDIPTIVQLRKEFATGEFIGPRLFLAGIADGRAATSNNISMRLTESSDIPPIIDTLVKNDYLELKIYNSVPPHLLPEAIAAAHARGLRIGGHVPAGIRMDDAIRLGFNDISHLNFALLNFLGDDVQKRTNTSERFTVPARLGADVDIESPAVKASIAGWCKSGIALDPTAVVLETLFTARPSDLAPYAVSYAHRLPPPLVRSLHGGGFPKTDAEHALFRKSFLRGMEILKQFSDCGGKIVPGTDGMAGFMLVHEFELYVKAGIPAAQVLRDATYGSAELARSERDLGSIEVGKIADLILVRGDPTQDISTLRNIDLIIKDGVSLDPARLNAAIGVAATNSSGGRNGN